MPVCCGVALSKGSVHRAQVFCPVDRTNALREHPQLVWWNGRVATNFVAEAMQDLMDFFQTNSVLVLANPIAFASFAMLFGSSGFMVGRYFLAERIANLESRIARRDDEIKELKSRHLANAEPPLIPIIGTSAMGENNWPAARLNGESASYAIEGRGAFKIALGVGQNQDHKENEQGERDPGDNRHWTLSESRISFCT
jgi:hypothetical protein